MTSTNNNDNNGNNDNTPEAPAANLAAATADPQNQWRNEHPYRADFGAATTADDETGRTHHASCYCGRVSYRTRGDPLDSKLCHCRGCQLLHGAPFEWVSIFEKSSIQFHDRASLDYLYFYNSTLDRGWDSMQAAQRILPCKVSCSHCRTPVADEGRNMWLAFATLFQFESIDHIPPAFRHSCHLFYGQRCIDMADDDKTKWAAHKNHSPRWDDKTKEL